MSYLTRIVVCAVLSAAGHSLLAAARAREAPPPPPLPPMVVRIVEQTPLPPPAPLPPAPEPTTIPTATPPRPRPAMPRPRVPRPTPQVPSVPAAATTTAPNVARPIYGVTLSSTSQAGASGAPVANTLDAAAPCGAGRPAASAAPIAADEVSAMPLPIGRCLGTYTDAARAAGLEGTVVLDLVVGADGTTTRVDVVRGLEHGLTEAAVSAAKGCRFRPGQRGGQPVAVRLRGFKIRFVLGH